MNDPSTYMLHESPDEWGGQWTEQKLDAFTKYVEAYLTILGKPFTSMDLQVSMSPDALWR